MHHTNIQFWQHSHLFNPEKKHVERKTLVVVIITVITMAAEIAFGWLSHSMALFADGWHMGTHAFALGISLGAYVLARKHAQDRNFAFGTWKIEILGAYSSAIVLGMVGILMVFTSIERLVHPLDIRYDQALWVAGLGLVVNAICAVILNGRDHVHEHGHGHRHHDHVHPHAQDPENHDPAEAHREHDPNADLNLKSAYLHVIADALMSVFAIVALLGAKHLHFNWLDPFMGIVGAAMILRWAVLLMRDAAGILLDRNPDLPLIQEITGLLESDGDTKISDLHVWKVADDKFACILSLVRDRGQTVEEYRKRLQDVHELAHVTIEINPCRLAGPENRKT